MRNDEELARLSAWILGGTSAAARALRELAQRRDSGEQVSIYSSRGMWLVGPTIEQERSEQAKEG